MTPRAGAQNGGYYLTAADGLITGKEFFALVPDAATVFEIINGINANGQASSFLTSMNILSRSQAAGSFIAVSASEKITDVKITSGSCWCYNKPYSDR